MATSKYPLGRYRIIDQLLRRKKFVKTKEIRTRIERDLSLHVADRTINSDITAMREDTVLRYFAPIEYSHAEKAYYYTNKEYTIGAIRLQEKEIDALMFYAKTLNQYKDYEIFKNFSGAIRSILDVVTIRKGIQNDEQAKSVVQTEGTPKFTGNEHISTVVRALNENKVIRFKYKKFNATEQKEANLAPYLLKEYKHLWYIVGFLDGKDTPTTYALDRIIGEVSICAPFERIPFDFEAYFTYTFGITVLDDAPIEVVLSFTSIQGNYIKNLALHSTQKVLIDSEDEFRISVQVKPSWEFYEKIMGFGDCVEVISPPNIVEEIKSKLEKALDRYNC